MLLFVFISIPILQVVQDLKAKRLFPGHHSKFALGMHPWDEPLTKITENNKVLNIPLVTPMIGEQVNLKDSTKYSLIGGKMSNKI